MWCSVKLLNVKTTVQGAESRAALDLPQHSCGCTGIPLAGAAGPKDCCLIVCDYSISYNNSPSVAPPPSHHNFILWPLIIIEYSHKSKGTSPNIFFIFQK